jgi:DNA repair ATPase RecN
MRASASSSRTRSPSAAAPSPPPSASSTRCRRASKCSSISASLSSSISRLRRKRSRRDATFNTYNTLEDTRTFLNRETHIYSSILEGYKAAMSSKSGRANFATEMANIAKGVQDSLGKVTGKLDTEASKKQSLDQQYKELVDKERLFVKLAGKFAEACGRNEKLEAEIAQLTNGCRKVKKLLVSVSLVCVDGASRANLAC